MVHYNTILLQEMALEENEKITRIETILEVEEEVKITPPARRKKAERMKNKSAGKLSSQACSDAVSYTHLTLPTIYSV